MNSSWKARIILAIGIGVIIFGDFLGYGNGNNTASNNNNDSNQINEQKRSINDHHTAIKEGSTSGKVEGNIFLCYVIDTLIIFSNWMHSRLLLENLFYLFFFFKLILINRNL